MPSSSGSLIPIFHATRGHRDPFKANWPPFWVAFCSSLVICSIWFFWLFEELIETFSEGMSKEELVKCSKQLHTNDNSLRQAIRDVCTSRTGHLPFGWGPSPGELYKVEPPMKRETLASDNRRKLHRIVFRASAQELRVIQSKAAAQRLTVSAYLRGTTDREVATPFVEPCRHDLMMAGRLARVSSGLTYLLRLMERNGGYPNAIEIASNIADLKTVMLELALKLRGRE